MSDLLTSGDLAGMQEVLNRSLPGTAVITRGTVTSDGGGGGTSVFVAAGTVACRLSPIMRQEHEQERGGALLANARRVLTVPAGTDIRTPDRVTVGSETFEVMDVNGPRDYELCVRCNLVGVK